MRRLALANLFVLRPVVAEAQLPSLAVVIPARNEAGNIEDAVKRLLPLVGQIPLEVIFVEGHSTDQTWAEIERVVNTVEGIQETAAIAVPRKDGGAAQLVIYTVLEPGVSLTKAEAMRSMRAAIHTRLNTAFRL